jgi:predicted Zn-dependent protease
MNTLVLLMLAATPPTGNAPIPSVMKELQEITTAQLKGNVGERRLAYEELVRKMPADALARVYLAWCDLPSDDSWNQLKGISSINPDNPWVHYGMGQIYALWKMKDPAKTELETVLKRDANFYPAMVTQGDLAAAAQDNAKAEERYRAALKLEPNDARANAGVGLLLLAQGKKPEGRVALQKAFDAWPDQPKVLKALFPLVKEEGDLKTAAKIAAALAELQPKDHDARKAIADLRFEQGDKAEAAKEYERLLRLGDPEVSVFERLSGIYKEANNGEAEEHVQQLWAGMQKENPDPPLRLAELMAARGAVEPAEGQMLEAINRDPKRADAQLMLGRSRLKRNDLFEALDALRAAAALEGAPADDAKKELAELEKKIRVPAKKAHGDVNAINYAVSGTLNDVFLERRRANPKLGGMLRVRVRVDKDGVVKGVDVVEDTVGDPIVTAHAYVALKDAQYPKQKREPVFEFELKGNKK